MTMVMIVLVVFKLASDWVIFDISAPILPSLQRYIKLSKAALCYPFSYVDVNHCLCE